MDGPVPAENVEVLRDLINQHLKSDGVYDQIKRFVGEYVSEGKDGQLLGEEEVIEALKERGIIDEVVRTLPVVRSLESAPQDAPVVPTHGRFLHLKINGGKAFLEHLAYSNDLPNMDVHVHYGAARFKTIPVAGTCEPAFDGSFLLEVAGEAKSSHVGTLATIKRGIHLLVTKTERNGTTHLVGTCTVEWRKALVNGHLKACVEVAGVGASASVPAGLLDVSIDVLPQLRTGEGLEEGEVTAQTKLEATIAAEADRSFFIMAKQWWREYLQTREAHKHRLVKIFALSEDGSNKPVCTFVQPISGGRLLETPRHAARFVSLMQLTEEVALDGGAGEVWHSLHTTLCTRQGGTSDHATLLCSLLLGFGLHAYVVVGTNSNGAHVWVMTLLKDRVTFWESLTGLRYTHEDSPVSHDYKTIGCVFNHAHFFANKQRSDVVEDMTFDLGNVDEWKSLPSAAVGGLRWPDAVPLSPGSVDCTSTCVRVERDLMDMVAEYRQDFGQDCAWEKDLAYKLAPALFAYELERITGVSVGNEEFQQSIRNAVPEGITFKAFPIQFNHAEPRVMWRALMKSRVCVDILQARGEKVRFALRAKVVAYAENVLATWVMLAVKYRS